MTTRHEKATANTSSRSDKLSVRAQITNGRHGGPTPEIVVTLPAGWPYRRLKAMLYGLAMDIEVITAKGESWVTEIEVLADGRGRVYLELAAGDQAEAERGQVLLEQVMQRQLDIVRSQ